MSEAKRGRGRPLGSGAKPAAERLVAWTFLLPPELLAEFQAAIPEGERAEFVRAVIRRELKRRLSRAAAGQRD